MSGRMVWVQEGELLFVAQTMRPTAHNMILIAVNYVQSYFEVSIEDTRQQVQSLSLMDIWAYMPLALRLFPQY